MASRTLDDRLWHNRLGVAFTFIRVGGTGVGGIDLWH